MKLRPTIKFVFASAILGIASTVFALPDISGNWKCYGHDPMKNKNVTLFGEIHKTGDTYSLSNWKEEGSYETTSGIGLHNDKLKNSLAIMFWSDKNSEEIGFGLYQIQSKDKLVGKWMMKNGKVTAEETCERVKALKYQT